MKIKGFECVTFSTYQYDTFILYSRKPSFNMITPKHKCPWTIWSSWKKSRKISNTHVKGIHEYHSPTQLRRNTAPEVFHRGIPSGSYISIKFPAQYNYKSHSLDGKIIKQEEGKTTNSSPIVINPFKSFCNK